jgi:salicylate hydroxylase
MAIEDAWVLSEHVGAQVADGADGASLDWDVALAAYQAVRPEHCRRVLTTARAWGKLWHLTDGDRLWRNDVMRERDVHDYSFVDWLYGSTALRPEDEPAMFEPLGREAVVGV